MHYDPSDHTLRYANGNEVPDETAVWAVLRERGLVKESDHARCATSSRSRAS